MSLRANRREVEFALRVLAIVRSAPDLDVDPFVPPEARSPFYDGGVALPLSILAPTLSFLLRRPRTIVES